MAETVWRELVERYAMHAREFADAVALLGQASLASEERLRILETIKAHHESSIAAAEEVDQFLRQKAAAVDAP
jgi:hypothetical protein